MMFFHHIAIISSLLLVFAGGRGTLGAPGVLFRQRLDAKDPLPPSVRAKIQIPAEAAHHHHHRLLSSSAYSNIDFSGFAVGDVVTDLGNGVTVSATKRLPDDTFEDGVAMIFDTANPTGGDWDLGAPHKSYGGPGLGKWGRKRGMLFPNSEPRGYSLIISENGDGTDPDDNAWGGYIVFSFDPPRFLDSVGFLDNDAGVTFTTILEDGSTDIRVNENGGNNSFEKVAIGKPMVCYLIVEFAGSGTITELDFSEGTCPSTASELLSLDMYAAGDTVSNFGAGGVSVRAIKRNINNDVELSSAMVFDSSNPTGGDFDLGTPNEDFSGPGIGNAGKQGKPFENAQALGNVLIISEDNDAGNPDDTESEAVLAFSFDPPRDIQWIGLLDNEEGTVFSIQTSDGGSAEIMNLTGGNNSYESVAIGKPSVTMIIVAFGGSGAVTDIVSCN